MKHPIAYRVVIYSAILILSASVLFLIHVMSGAPFKSSDMRDAWYHGCNYGSRPLTNESVANCSKYADLFKQTLDDLDRQMEMYEKEMLKNSKE